MDEMDEVEINHLELGDWRRRVAGLYAEVRQIAATDPVAALEHWRSVRERLYREHPQSPVPMAERSAFRARHFPHDRTLRFEAAVIGDASPTSSPSPDSLGSPGKADETSETSETSEPGETSETGRTGLAAPAAIPMSTGSPLAFRRVGWVDIPFSSGARRLALHWIDGYGGGLFLPFRDATNGTDTYGAGRYLLDAAKSADLGGDIARGTLILDFNFAYHPSCAFDPRWSCPLAPPENRLDVAIRAGERLS